MPIPILRLPYLALKNVLAYGNDVELLTIFLCSSKTNRAVKVCRGDLSVLKTDSHGMLCFNDLEKFQLLLSETGRSDIKENINVASTSLEIAVSEVISLEFRVGWPVKFKLIIDETSQMEKYEKFKKVLKLDGTYISFIFTADQLYTFWDDKLQGLQFFIKYFEKNFYLEKCYWVFENSEQDLKPLVAYLNSMPNENEDGLRVKKVTVDRWAILSDSDYKYLMETVTHKLTAEMRVSKDFEFTGQFATKNLNLKSAHWFTFKHLLNCKCESVEVKGSKITNIQLRMFIRRWSNGELYHFKEVKVKLEKEVNCDVILKGREIVREMPSRWRANVIERWMIQGKNGERAVIGYENECFVFSKSNK